MEGPLVLILVVVAIAALVGGLWLYKKYRYIKSIRERGWTWVESPDIGITIGLNSAPFGIGFSRKVDNQVIGSGTTGVPFQAFRYSTDSFSSSGYVVTMQLPKSLPTVAAFHPEGPCTGVSGTLVASTPLHVVARPSRLRTRVRLRPLSGAPRAGEQPAPTYGYRRRRGPQPTRHVAHPREPENLALAVSWLERVHQSLMSSHAAAFDGAPTPAHLSFQDRDHWVYRPFDDSMLNHVTHTGGGFNHAAKDIITSENQGLPFIRLTHTWQTQTTTTDGKGNTTTHTQNHSEDIAEFRTTFAFRQSSVNWGMLKGFGGNRVEFESSAFNQMFKVRCPVPRFASDVFHPPPTGLLHAHGRAGRQHRGRRAHPRGGWELVPPQNLTGPPSSPMASSRASRTPHGRSWAPGRGPLPGSRTTTPERSRRRQRPRPPRTAAL